MQGCLDKLPKEVTDHASSGIYAEKGHYVSHVQILGRTGGTSGGGRNSQLFTNWVPEGEDEDNYDELKERHPYRSSEMEVYLIRKRVRQYHELGGEECGRAIVHVSKGVEG